MSKVVTVTTANVCDEKVLYDMENQSYFTVSSSTSGASLADLLKDLQNNQLSSKEKEELESLKSSYKEQLKLAKLQFFKKLPTSLRQFVVDNLSWGEVCKEIDSLNLDKSERMRSLEDKEQFSSMFSGKLSQSYNIGDMFSPPYFSGIKIPDGLSLEDIKNAHAEACIEEEMLNGTNE